MNDTLEFLARRFGLDLSHKSPLIISECNRTIMAQTLNELGFKVGAEIGVAQGDHSKMLCDSIPGLKLYCVDVWERYPGFREYTDRIGRYYEQAQAKLAPYNVVIVKKFSMEAVKDFADGSLDFVYIDAAHDFKNVVDDVCEWSKKVRIGGMVFGHDYKGHSKGPYVRDVKWAVQAYVYAKGIRPWFVLANGIKDPTFGNDVPGWMFVRQEGDQVCNV